MLAIYNLYVISNNNPNDTQNTSTLVAGNNLNPGRHHNGTNVVVVHRITSEAEAWTISTGTMMMMKKSKEKK